MKFLLNGHKTYKACKKYNIDYFTASYDTSIISYLNKFVPAWKVGSGDITGMKTF